MKTIGLIGGMSWESSAEYYRLINTLVKERWIYVFLLTFSNTFSNVYIQ